MVDSLKTITKRLATEERAAAFTRYAFAMLKTAGDARLSFALLEAETTREVHAEFTKATVDAMSGTTQGALLASGLASAWMEGVAKRSVLGRMTQTLPAPFLLTVPVVVDGVTASWVGDGSAIPATSGALDTVALAVTRLACILGFSEEFSRAAGDRAVALFDALVRRAVVEAEDSKVLSDDVAVPGVSPAGLLAGLSPEGSGADLDADIAALWSAVRSGNPIAPIFIVSGAGAMFLAGQSAAMFREVSPADGRLAGVPCIVSPAAGNGLILVDQASVAVADGGIELASGRSASVMMQTPGSPPEVGYSHAFQMNLALLRVFRVVNWVLGHADGAGFVQLPLGS